MKYILIMLIFSSTYSFSQLRLRVKESAGLSWTFAIDTTGNFRESSWLCMQCQKGEGKWVKKMFGYELFYTPWQEINVDSNYVVCNNNAVQDSVQINIIDPNDSTNTVFYRGAQVYQSDSMDWHKETEFKVACNFDSIIIIDYSRMAPVKIYEDSCSSYKVYMEQLFNCHVVTRESFTIYHTFKDRYFVIDKNGTYYLTRWIRIRAPRRIFLIKV